MRIFCAIPNYEKAADRSRDPDAWAERDFMAALRATKHDLVIFDWALPYPLDAGLWRQSLKSAKNRELIETVRQKHREKRLDLFFTVDDASMLDAGTLIALRSIGILTANYHCDDVTAFHRNKDRVNLYDLNWTNNRAAIPNYTRLGARYIYTPFGANPDIYKPWPAEQTLDVSFVGTNIGYREEFLQSVISCGVKARIYGRGWPTRIRHLARRFGAIWLTRRGMTMPVRFSVSLWYLSYARRLPEFFKAPLVFDDVVRLFSRSRINLSFAGGMGAHMCSFQKAPRSMKLRDMEVTMSGGFLLAEHSNEIASLFEVGKEIATFTSKHNLIEKIRYYLTHADDAKAIAEAGRRRALRDYTWASHMHRLLDAALELRTTSPMGRPA